MAKVGQFQYPYPRPSMTVDSVLWTLLNRTPHVLLIQRKHDPFTGRWAIPGGFVDQGERLEDATRRELVEETGVAVRKLWPLGSYGDPGRDPRGWTISAVYYAAIAAKSAKARAGDDAADAKWHSIGRLPSLAFDHAKILKDAKARLSLDIYNLPILRPLVGNRFSKETLIDTYRCFDPKENGSAIVRRLMVNGVIRRTAETDEQFQFVNR